MKELQEIERSKVDGEREKDGENVNLRSLKRSRESDNDSVKLKRNNVRERRKRGK